jgi:hypothetical protein
MVECRCFSNRWGRARLLHDLVYSPSLRTRRQIFPLASVADVLLEGDNVGDGLR